MVLKTLGGFQINGSIELESCEMRAVSPSASPKPALIVPWHTSVTASLETSAKDVFRAPIDNKMTEEKVVNRPCDPFDGQEPERLAYPLLDK